VTDDIVFVERGELDTADDLDLESAVYSWTEEWDESTGFEMAVGGGAETGG